MEDGEDNCLEEMESYQSRQPQGQMVKTIALRKWNPLEGEDQGMRNGKWEMGNGKWKQEWE